MERNKYGKKSQFTIHNILFWTVGIILTLTMFSTCMVSNLYAKYVVEHSYTDSARVAAGGEINIYEHEPKLENGIYVLNESIKTTAYTYRKVIPGVDIAKDPIIELKLDKSEVDYELFVQVTESDFFPETVTYELTNTWELFDEDKNIYKYKGIFDAGTPYSEIHILKDDKLYVSEYYVGKDKDGNDLEFSLTFKAWLRQAD